MDKFARLGSSAARAELRIAQRIGQQASLVHRGGTPATIWVSVLQQETGSEATLPARQKELMKAVLLIPVQGTAIYATNDATAIAVSPEAKCITVGDRLEWPLNSGRHYFVNEDVEAIHNGYAYLVKIEACRPITLGQRS